MPVGEKENPEDESSGTSVPRPPLPENPDDVSTTPPSPPDPGGGWAEKAKEIPLIGRVVEKAEPYYDEYLKPLGDKTGIGPVLREVVDFFDPTPGIYELATGKDWETGEELGAYDQYVEPFLEYLVAKKVNKGGKLLAKADEKLTGGKITGIAGELLDPVREKRDQLVRWACSEGGLFSERALPTAYADPGGSKPDKDCLMQQVLGWSGKNRTISRFSGELVKVNKPDPEADKLAKRISGQSCVRFSNDPQKREFDVVSDKYIGQTKPALKNFGKKERNQWKATFEAAKETGRIPYFHFEGEPSQKVINQLYEYSRRYGINFVIDTKPLN